MGQWLLILFYFVRWRSIQIQQRLRNTGEGPSENKLRLSNDDLGNKAV
jgi:hypothetical protein